MQEEFHAKKSPRKYRGKAWILTIESQMIAIGFLNCALFSCISSKTPLRGKPRHPGALRWRDRPHTA